MMRPQPNLEMLGITEAFYPDQDGLGEWSHATFLQESSKLYNPDHSHLVDATIGWLWTNAANESRGRSIVGEAKLLPPVQSRWSSAMFHFQIRQWFGFTPDFLITISSDFARFCDDMTFCALIEHELYHCAQKVDLFGMPAFDREGNPSFTMKGHDVEEFVGVARRYGADATGTKELKKALEEGPTIGLASVAAACGTCQMKRVA